MSDGSLNLWEISFTNNCLARLDEVCNLVIGRQLWFPRGRLGDYPDIGDWSQKVWVELHGGTKRAIVAMARVGHGEKIIGVAIYQRHKTNSDWLELKNLSVSPEYAGRGVASFLLKQAELEGTREFGTQKIVCDVKANRIDFISFLRANRWRLVDTGIDLYGLRAGLDAVFEKDTTELSARFNAQGNLILPVGYNRQDNKLAASGGKIVPHFYFVKKIPFDIIAGVKIGVVVGRSAGQLFRDSCFHWFYWFCCFGSYNTSSQIFSDTGKKVLGWVRVFDDVRFHDYITTI